MSRGNRTFGKFGEIKNTQVFGHEFNRGAGPLVEYKLSPDELERLRLTTGRPPLKKEENILSKLSDKYPTLDALLASKREGQTWAEWEAENGITNSSFFQLKKKYETQGTAPPQKDSQPPMTKEEKDLQKIKKAASRVDRELFKKRVQAGASKQRLSLDFSIGHKVIDYLMQDMKLEWPTPGGKKPELPVPEPDPIIEDSICQYITKNGKCGSDILDSANYSELHSQETLCKRSFRLPALNLQGILRQFAVGNVKCLGLARNPAPWP